MTYKKMTVSEFINALKGMFYYRRYENKYREAARKLINDLQDRYTIILYLFHHPLKVMQA